jgi:hypothetical protein
VTQCGQKNRQKKPVLGLPIWRQGMMGTGVAMDQVLASWPARFLPLRRSSSRT